MNLWNIRAWYYKGFRKYGPFKRILNREHGQIKNILKQSGRTFSGIGFDVACGAGHSRQTVPPGLKVICLDLSRSMLTVAKKNKVKAWLVNGNARQIPAKTNCAGYLQAVGLTEYLSPDELSKFLAECHRVLRGGGLLLLTSSPQTLFGYCRQMVSPKLFMRNCHEIKRLCRQQGFTVLHGHRSFTQDVVLSCKNDNPA